jgi:hypothetical protein
VLTFAPVADAYVSAAEPAANFGHMDKLRVDGSPELRSYLRFDVQGLTEPITKATLRIWANSGASAGWEVYGVSDATWGEPRIAYINAPPVGELAGSSGPVAAETWTEADVTKLVTGNGPVSFVVIGPSATALSLSSREGPNSPHLVVEAGGVEGSKP